MLGYANGQGILNGDLVGTAAFVDRKTIILTVGIQHSPVSSIQRVLPHCHWTTSWGSVIGITVSGMGSPCLECNTQRLASVVDGSSYWSQHHDINL